MMRTLGFLSIMTVMATAACSNGGGNAVDPNNGGNGNDTLPSTGATVRMLGRFQNSDPNGPIMSWPGSSLIAGFTGTSLAVNLNEPDSEVYNGNVTDNEFDVYIDGSTTPTTLQLKHGITNYTVVTGLQDANHSVVMSKRTESDMGGVQYLGFVPEAGKSLIAAPPAKSHMIEFVGDSGTGGYGADANVTLTTMCTFTPQTEQADASYAAFAARDLDADLHNTSYSGKGIYQNRDVVGDAVLTLPVLWGRTCGDTDFEAVPWNPNQWVPQAVVVIVGGNDFFANIPPATAYNTTAVKFLQTLRTAYGPNCQLFVAVSPMIRGTFVAASDPQNVRGPAEQYAKAMVSTMNGNGDSKVHYISLPEDDGSRGWGCDQHLTIASGAYYGNMIAQAVAQQTGWTAQNLTAP